MIMNHDNTLVVPTYVSRFLKWVNVFLIVLNTHMAGGRARRASGIGTLARAGFKIILGICRDIFIFYNRQAHIE